MSGESDLYEDMSKLNALYEELMWPHDEPLDFKAEFENNRIIIQLKLVLKKLKMLCIDDHEWLPIEFSSIYLFLPFL